MALVAATLSLVVSCSKEEPVQIETKVSQRISINITGEMGDYSPAEGITKAIVESVVRVKWAEGDKVYVLDNQKCLGYLTASVDADDPRYAVLSGEVEGTVSSKLLLLYCPSLTLEEGDEMASVDFDFSSQVGENVPFVIYQVIDNDFVQISDSNIGASGRIIRFKFASSVMKVNITGLADDQDISEVILSPVNNGLSISMNGDGEVTITPMKIGSHIITRSGDAGLSGVTADGRSAFTVAMVENELKTDRKIAVKVSDGKVYTSKFTASRLEAGASYNSVYALNVPDYVTIGGKKWTTMNLGATTVASSAETAYGDYYEWGKTRKLYNGLIFNSCYDVVVDFEDEFKENGYSWWTYIGAGDWSPGKDFKPYDETSKVLTTENDIASQVMGGSWRMPTFDDFSALYQACGGTGTLMVPSAITAARNGDGSLNKGIYWCEYGQNTFDDIIVPGMLFIDGNGNTLFFPAAGGGFEKLITYEGNSGDYWSSNLVTTYGTDWRGTGSAINMDFNDSSISVNYTCTRLYGLSIRPVSD